jgi:hypothetical protein
MRGPVVLLGIFQYIRKAATSLTADDGYSGDAPYLNIPFYQERTEPEEDSREVGMGPPSMYNEPDDSGHLKNKEDIRRQGERPEPSDRMEKEYERPVTQTCPIGEPRENLQGGPWNDTTKPRGSDDNDRDTYAPDEGDLTNYDEKGNVQL